MRTKTKVLSALLGVLGSASLMAQSTNVYSLNAVGYINVTMAPGFNMISCPLIASPDNTVGTILNNGSGVYNGSTVYFYSPANGYSLDTANSSKTANTNGWVNNGTNALNPGVACWFLNNQATNLVATFVGTVPQGSLTNILSPGFNLVSSAVPTSGDIVTNSIMNLTNYNPGDAVYTYSPTAGYALYQSSATKGSSGYLNQWTALGDPVMSNVGGGFWYLNNKTTVSWVENFSVNP